MAETVSLPKEENNNQEIIGQDKQKSKLWKQNSYDLGTWTKERLMKCNNMNCRRQLQNIDHMSLNNPIITKKAKNSSLSWNIIVEIIPNEQFIFPNNITLSTLSSLLSITQNTTHSPRKKTNDKVDEYITTWEID